MNKIKFKLCSLGVKLVHIHFLWHPQNNAHYTPVMLPIGCWGYNGEQKRPPPLFPLILQPSGWSPWYPDLPGKTEIFLMVGPNRDSLVD